MYKLRTIDVWDTLLRRACHPEAVKLATALHIFSKFRHLLAPEIAVDHWQIYTARNTIEATLARESEQAGYDNEYDIIHVFQRLLQEIFSQSLQSDITQLATEFAEYELAFEMKVTFPDPDIKAFISAFPAEKTLYLSDFYMGSDMLRRLLSHHGLTAIVPEGLVSCDVRLNKRSGHLFEYVEKLYGVTPEEHVHIGDNPYADVKIPHQLGIKAVPFLPDEGHTARQQRETVFSSRAALFTHLHSLTQQSENTAQPLLTEDAAAAFQVGLQAAPLFIAFALFIAERAIEQTPDHLFFFTREGEFFHKVFKALFPLGQHAGHTLPETSDLCVSRHATFAASIKSLSLAELSRIWSLNSQQKTSTLFGIFGLEPSDYSHILQNLGLPPDELITNPEHDERVQSLFKNQEFLSAAQKSIEKKYANLYTYLQQKGIEPGQVLSCVDIGWRGTIQDNLAYILPDNQIFGCYLALRRFVNPQPQNVAKMAFGPDERVAYDMSFFETFEPLEMLCNSAHGSVTGYANQQGKMVPVREIHSQENKAFEKFARHFQDGVIAATKIQQPFIANHAVHSSEMRTSALQVWKTLARQPPRQLLEAYYTSPQHDLFGFGGFFDRGQIPSLGMLVHALFNAQKRALVIQYIKRTQWTAGLQGLKIGYFNKVTLNIVFWLAHRYKWLMTLKRR